MVGSGRSYCSFGWGKRRVEWRLDWIGGATSTARPLRLAGCAYSAVGGEMPFPRASLVTRKRRTSIINKSSCALRR